LPGEQPCKESEHDDLLELFGYDEEQGFSRIVLEQGTEIEIPIEDEQGVTFWIASEVSICHEGSLNFRAEFPSRTLDTGIWKQTRSRADMDVTWRLPPALRKRQTAVHMILNTQGIHIMAPPSNRLTLAWTPTSRGMDLREPRGDGRRAEQGIWMENSIVYHKYGS